MLFDLDLDSWIHKAKLVANRNLTRDQWRQYFASEPYHRTCRELPWPSDLPKNEREQAEQKEKD